MVRKNYLLYKPAKIEKKEELGMSQSCLRKDTTKGLPTKGSTTFPYHTWEPNSISLLFLKTQAKHLRIEIVMCEMKFNCSHSTFNDIERNISMIKECENRNDSKWKRKGHPCHSYTLSVTAQGWDFLGCTSLWVPSPAALEKKRL